MLAREAGRLREVLLGQRDISPLLNLGSSTRHFREIAQPHIDRDLFQPLRQAGVIVVHGDLKAADGVDLAGDILDAAVAADLRAKHFRCILLANLLEHVRDAQAVAAACEAIVEPGGLILATVPSSYPFHADPIDTFYRPSPTELAGLFGRSETLLAEELTGPTYAEDFRARGSALAKELARTAWAALTFPARPKSAKSRLHRWRWYSRPYRISIALVRVGLKP